MSQLGYTPGIFNVDSIEAAKAIILTPEGGTTKERWEKETPWLVDLAVAHLNLTPDSMVIDYGCGIGRLARELILRTGCWVIGVDISPSMRALAASYVSSHRFMCVAPEAIQWLPKADAVLAVWVIQHVLDVAKEVNRLKVAMKDGAQIMVVNNHGRAVPTHDGWASDGVDVAGTLEAIFEPLGEPGTLPVEIDPPGLVAGTYWRFYRKAAEAEAGALAAG